MRYELFLSAVPTPGTSAADRNTRFLSALRRMDWMWNFGDHLPKLPNQNPWPSLGLTLSRYCTYNTPASPRAVSSEVMYAFRSRIPSDEIREYDDLFWVRFNPAKLDYARLLADLPDYVEAFGAHNLTVENREFFGALCETGEITVPGSANGIDAFPPIFYVDDTRCQRAFDRSVDEIAALLEGHVERTQRLGDGLLVILHSQPQPLEKDLEDNRRLKRLLPTAPGREL